MTTRSDGGVAMLTLLDDLPVEVEKELWPGLDKLAGQLSRLIPVLPSTSPVLVSGDWGAGKTTLLKAVARKIPEEDRRIFFEAWRYESEALLLPALLRAIWDKLPAEKKNKEPTLGARIFKTALTLSLSMGGSLAKLAGGPASIAFEGLMGLFNQEQTDKAQQTEPPKDKAGELQKDFQALVEAWTEDAPLIVFVDDLDRCGPEGAVGLLEALRMLLHQTACSSKLPCRFVVALDRKVLTHAVALKYEGVNRYEGNRFLEKLFPFSFELPQPQGGEVHQLVEKILGDKQGGENEGNERDALATALGDAVFANPRLIKRCVNRFRLILEFERDREKSSGRAAKQAPESPESLETLARWIAAVERWPNLRRLLASRNDDFWRQLREALANPSGAQLDTDVRSLLQEDGVEAWMRTTLLSIRGDQVSAYREANRRLRAWGL
jgi:hypothetical protein